MKDKNKNIELYSKVQISGTDKTGTVVSFSDGNGKHPVRYVVEIDGEEDIEKWMEWHSENELVVIEEKKDHIQS